MRSPEDTREPSAESLQAIPERTGPHQYFKGRGPEALGNARRFGAAIRGRPRAGQEAIGTSTKTLRLPNDVWAEVEALAVEREMTVHKLLRLLVAQALYTTPEVPPMTAAGRRRHKRLKQAEDRRDQPQSLKPRPK